ncbi:nuclease associated modular domain 3 protein [Vibrio phage 1.081.O._10N.286.52.C2]|nr:nuclease associated modular domain 3 protein [Vibrio phage 1.081.O._10N.286.52.C2]
MYYIVYKTTNKTNGKIYIGAHKTEDLEDGYIGSGKLLKRAINKYGVDSFECEILEQCDSSDEMYEREAVYVDREFVENSMTYNLKLGGEGGFDHLNRSGIPHTDESKAKISKTLSGRAVSDKIREKYADNYWVKRGEERYAAAVEHGIKIGKQDKTESQKQKISESLKRHYEEHSIDEVTCPHCGKVGKGGVMKRWHFDNCKHAPMV